MNNGMDERSKALVIAVTGETRQKALRECQKQLESWDLAMPPHAPP